VTTRISQSRSTEVIIPLYSLCARFEVLLELFLEEALEKNPPPPLLDDEDKKENSDAHEENLRRAIWSRMLFTMEEKIRLIGRKHPSLSLQIASTVAALESTRLRLELNYPIIASLENFLLLTARNFSIASPLS
jgi:hypothetical protein